MLSSQAEQELLEIFIPLTERLAQLSECIRQDSDKVAWVQLEDKECMEDYPVREKIITIINQLQYGSTQLPREIIICAGFVGASNETLQIVEQVNQTKDAFKQKILSLKMTKVFTQPELMTHFNEILMRYPTTSALLRKTGLSRLHLKQCYRKFPILPLPSKISWTWAHTRSIKKISIETALSLLLKRGEDTGIQIQIQKLGTLHPNESLAIVQELAPHLRANLVWELPTGECKRKIIKGSVPFFFPADPSTPCPHFTPPGNRKEKDQNRSIRSDVKLDPVLFLPAIRAHRYTC